MKVTTESMKAYHLLCCVDVQVDPNADAGRQRLMKEQTLIF